jgi:hypothetical protein
MIRRMPVSACEDWQAFDGESINHRIQRSNYRIAVWNAQSSSRHEILLHVHDKQCVAMPDRGKALSARPFHS